MSFIAKKARLIHKQLGKIIIRNRIIKQKKEILTKMLYNKNVILASNFTKIEKVKKKVTSLQKILIIKYNAWQILNF